MFNPEFRYLIAQEERNGQMLPNIDYALSATVVCIANLLCVLVAGWSVYNIFNYIAIVTKYLATSFWNILTPGNEWLEIVLMLSSLVAATMVYKSLKGMGDILDSKFTELKDLISKKEEHIKDLEEKLRSTQEKLRSTQEKLAEVSTVCFE